MDILCDFGVNSPQTTKLVRWINTFMTHGEHNSSTKYSYVVIFLNIQINYV